MADDVHLANLPIRGPKVNVYYDPKNPATAVLDPTPELRFAQFLLILGSVLLVRGMLRAMGISIATVLTRRQT